MAASRALTGIVSIQAQSRLIVTPQRTADNLLVAPTPMIEPVIVWVVLTGMPNLSDRNKVRAPAVSALTPSSGVTFVILVPMVFTIFHPPLIVPRAIAVKLATGTHIWVSINCLKDKSCPLDFSYQIMAAPMIPITFWASLLPCPRLSRAEDTSCNRRNQLSARYGLARRQILIMRMEIKKPMTIPIKGARKINRKVGITLP